MTFSPRGRTALRRVLVVGFGLAAATSIGVALVTMFVAQRFTDAALVAFVIAAVLGVIGWTCNEALDVENGRG